MQILALDDILVIEGELDCFSVFIAHDLDVFRFGILAKPADAREDVEDRCGRTQSIETGFTHLTDNRYSMAEDFDNGDGYVWGCHKFLQLSRDLFLQLLRCQAAGHYVVYERKAYLAVRPHDQFFYRKLWFFPDADGQHVFGADDIILFEDILSEQANGQRNETDASEYCAFHVIISHMTTNLLQLGTCFNNPMRNRQFIASGLPKCFPPINANGYRQFLD
jgi:hypothetical protein